jgi:hypothetical protein
VDLFEPFPVAFLEAGHQGRMSSPDLYPWDHHSCHSLVALEEEQMIISGQLHSPVKLPVALLLLFAD